MTHLSARTPSELEMFAHLSVPIWVFDLDRYRIWWGNDAALEFWKAGSMDALRARDFSTDSDTVHLRLRQTLQELGKSGKIYETWTLYPAGAPVRLTLSCRSIEIEDGRAALFVEASHITGPQTDIQSARLQESVRYAAAMLSMYAMDGALLTQNAHAFACYGGPDPSATGSQIGHLSQRLSAPGAAASLLADIAQFKDFDAELAVQTAAGHRIHRVRAHQGRDPATGDAVAVLNEDDITDVVEMRERLHALNTNLERHVAERSRQLQISEERFSLAMQGANDGLWDLDIASGDVYLAPRWYTMMGYAPGEVEVSATAILNLVHPGDRHLVDPARLTAGAQEGPAAETEFRLRHKDGHWVDVLTRAFVVVRDGTVTRMVGTNLDITERKKTERSLRRLKEILFEGSEALPVGVAYFDSELKLVMWNSLYATMQPRCAAILVPGTKFADILKASRDSSDPGDAGGNIASRLAQARKSPQNWVETLGDGRTFAQAAIPTSGDGVIAVVEDITEKRARQRQLRQAQKMEAVGQLTGGVAHDFNNLLAVIMGNLELLDMEVSQPGGAPADPTEARGLIATALDAVRQGADLTGSMLSYARKAQLAPKIVDINETVRQTERWMRRAIESNVVIEANLPTGIDPVRLDGSALQNALLNLVLNARDAMPSGGTLKIETQNVRIDDGYFDHPAETVSPGCYVMVSVSDDGAGIAPEVIEQIYDPFFTTKPVGKGSGLGLSMVEGFVRQSGGTIRVRSVQGQGTCFCLYFRAEAQEATSATPVEAAATPEIQATKARVLLVEDRPEVMLVLERILLSAGYDVLTAMNGDAGFELFKTARDFDLVVTDIVMPGRLQGPAFAQACRRLRPSMPFIFLSGYAPDSTAQDEALQDGDPRLMKPISRDDLLAAISKCLNGAAVSR
ncbi:ATP-binding protein [Roseovarius arcticus]|uniref:ATP-binding protein n=1 Tax=Roseovarius arcticus TaxID=2547404 RepID=UPI0011102207|nr:ATP-binding protein [Roseovarius arcticus]